MNAKTSLLNQPLKINRLVLRNRLVLAPMQQYQGTPESFATQHHVDHYGRRARHVGLVILESVAVSPDGRLNPNDIGIFTDRHVAPIRKIADAIRQAGAPAFIQLSHGGRKSDPQTTRRLVGPSAIPYDDFFGTPNALTLSEIESIVQEYRLAARRSLHAGFDGIEVHAAHGFLVHQFLSPLTNRREDAYGGSLEGRARLLREIVAAVRAETGDDYPVIVRVSATDYASDGLTAGQLGEMLKGVDIDAVDVSTGGLLPVAPEHTPDGYQLPYAAAIKQHVRVPVIAVGNIHRPDYANRILEDGLADAIAIGRPMLRDPDFAASMLGIEAGAKAVDDRACKAATS
ncbi:oxidoreductase [Cohnella nanjingensis]|uniref:tRNA-dihydrouridine synthase n=1 Tax=Cohnella nanjingensis TaxID=1387779 RepID=A0A7X0RUR4_9BACL|nr:tRNA-dihydrouridine synthase [Cohnella nanjingensis]MBB6672780.1 tRNA-dihydrouridine synthase [Cohnella nanjingensis]